MHSASGRKDGRQACQEQSAQSRAPGRDRRITDLPDELLKIVFRNLDCRDEAACALVCRNWLRIARSGRQTLRVVVHPGLPNENVFPARAVGPLQLQELLARYPHLTGLRLAAADVRKQLQLPPLPQLRSLDLEGSGLSSLSEATWQLLENLTALRFTVSNCGSFPGKPILTTLPNLQELGITCLSGDLDAFLRALPEMPALEAFSLSSQGSMAWMGAEDVYPWMRNLQRLQMRFTPDYGGSGRYRVLEAVLRSCSRVEDLSLFNRTFSKEDVLAAADVRSLRSLHLQSHFIFTHSSHEVVAAWSQLQEKLKSLCSSHRVLHGVVGTPYTLDLSQLPSSLQNLGLPLPELPSNEKANAYASGVSRLVNLRQLNLQAHTFLAGEDLTGLRGLTKLQMHFRLKRDLSTAGVLDVHVYVQILWALPQLQELVLEINVFGRTRRDLCDSEALLSSLASAICSSSATVDLSVWTCFMRPRLLNKFVSLIGERLVQLRIVSPWLLDCHASSIEDRKKDAHEVFRLPPKLQRLQLTFKGGNECLAWIEQQDEEVARSLTELRFVCLLSSAVMPASQRRHVIQALHSLFPALLEVCIHRRLDLCARCEANKMGLFSFSCWGCLR